MSGGKVNTFFVANGMSELRFPNAGDVSPFSNADGSEEGLNLEFSEILGRRRRRKAPRKKPLSNVRKAFQDTISPEARKERKDLKRRKMSLKEQQAATQSKIAESMSKTSPEEQALINQLNTGSGNNPPPKSGMSKNLKTGLIVGGVVVAIVVTVLVVRKMKSTAK